MAGRPKKIIESEESPLREELVALLKKKMHACYDREPTGSLTGAFEVMVDDIMNLFEQ